MATIQSQILSILDKLLSDTLLTEKQTDRILAIVEKMSDFPVSQMAEVEEQQGSSKWEVYLLHDGGKKIQTIKIVRNLKKLGLKETKELVESAPCLLKADMWHDDAKHWLEMLTINGAKAEMRTS